MEPLEFYRLVEEHLNEQAHSKGITDLNKYYHLTDYYNGRFLNYYQDKAQVFAQIAFHAQNAPILSNIVEFEENLSFLSRICCGFEPACFCLEYPRNDLDKSIRKLVDRLRYDSQIRTDGLKWNDRKSKKGNEDTLVKRYAASLICAADFVNKYESKQAFLDELKNQYQDNDYKHLISFFRENIPHGFSVALTCDFLKEFDECFSDLPKPDTHIKVTLRALYGLNKYFFYNEKKDLDCIKMVRELVQKINEGLQEDQRITVYQLDRMIWLICSGKFFLDDKGGYKKRFITAIEQKATRS